MKDKADLTIQCTFSNKTTFTNTFDTKGNGAKKYMFQYITAWCSQCLYFHNPIIHKGQTHIIYNDDWMPTNVFCFVYRIHSCVDPCADAAWFSSSLASWWPLYWTYFKSRITSPCFLPRRSTVYPPRPGGSPPSVARLLVSWFFLFLWECCYLKIPTPHKKKVNKCHFKHRRLSFGCPYIVVHWLNDVLKCLFYTFQLQRIYEISEEYE